MSEHMPKQEAINHIVSSTKYWSGETIDDSYYPNHLGLTKAFKMAIEHVKNSHGAVLDEKDIEVARKRLGLKSPVTSPKPTLDDY